MTFSLTASPVIESFPNWSCVTTIGCVPKASPAVADGVLVIGTLDGPVYCFGSPAGAAP
ncbi:MAG: hypothetical protein IIB57_12930 [Planctomycetes bacterium]|nr:hypothetical protein [Planctomycetota bacterium]